MVVGAGKVVGGVRVIGSFMKSSIRSDLGLPPRQFSRMASRRVLPSVTMASSVSLIPEKASAHPATTRTLQLSAASTVHIARVAMPVAAPANQGADPASATSSIGLNSSSMIAIGAVGNETATGSMVHRRARARARGSQERPPAPGRSTRTSDRTTRPV